MQPLIIYGAGDAGTAELRNLCAGRCKVEFRDIRKLSRNGVRENLAELNRQGLRRVPQVFSSDGHYIGGFEKALAVIQAMPKAGRAPRRAG